LFSEHLSTIADKETEQLRIRAANLETDNLLLADDVTLSEADNLKTRSKVAGLEKAAADAKTKLAFVTGHCSLNLDKTAEELLNSRPKGQISEILYADNECALVLAQNLFFALQKHGWKIARFAPRTPPPSITVGLPNNRVSWSSPFSGIVFMTEDSRGVGPGQSEPWEREPVTTLAKLLCAEGTLNKSSKCIGKGGIEIRAQASPFFSHGQVAIIIGPKF
jgi:hypothetical protein